MTAIFRALASSSAPVPPSTHRAPPRDRRTPEEASSPPIEAAVRRLVRQDLVDRPHEPIAELPCNGQASREQGELHPREEGTEPKGASPVPVETLGPVEVEEPDARAESPEPSQREHRPLDGLEALRGQVPVQESQVWVPGRAGEARDPRPASCLIHCGHGRLTLAQPVQRNRPFRGRGAAQPKLG